MLESPASFRLQARFQERRDSLIGVGTTIFSRGGKASSSPARPDGHDNGPGGRSFHVERRRPEQSRDLPDPASALRSGDDDADESQFRAVEKHLAAGRPAAFWDFFQKPLQYLIGGDRRPAGSPRRVHQETARGEPRPVPFGGDDRGRAPRRSVAHVRRCRTTSRTCRNTSRAPPRPGDLGAFLRDRLTPGMRNVRVTVVGSGPHRFTPVRLPQGLWLELRVEPFAAAEPPSWSPHPNATGPSPIELRERCLALSNMVLRHEEPSRLEHLIHVEDGHLVLSRCQFIAQGSADDFPGDLIAFTAASTRPYPNEPNRLLLSFPVDRPVCRIDESVQIAGGTALRLELGRGLVCAMQCAIAGAANAVELLPSPVSRQRFEADLVMDRCTMTSEHSVIRLGPWPVRRRGRIVPG